LLTRRLIAILSVFTILWGPPSAAQPRNDGGGAGDGRRQAPLELTCDACLLTDDSGLTLYARAPTAELPNASTTKMMTALLVSERANLDEVVRVSPAAASTIAVGVDLKTGEKWSVRSLLYGVLLASSNESAVALAEHVAGSESAFVADMNERAKAMGLRNTHFENPHGLDQFGHHSSAADLAVLGRRVLADPILAPIVDDASESVEGPGGKVVLENRNVLLDSYRGADGVKTGFTSGAGQVLVASAKRAGQRLVAVAMRSENAAEDARALLDFGFASRFVLVSRGLSAGTLTFDPGGSVEVVPREPLRGLKPRGRVEVRLVVNPGLSLPVDRGDVVGSLEVSAEGQELGSVEAIAVESMEPSSSSWWARVIGSLLGAVHALASVVS
jgi:D-alanyl-D-alanine carboxypeptidase (penicillin-binding protein 5/6)